MISLLWLENRPDRQKCLRCSVPSLKEQSSKSKSLLQSEIERYWQDFWNRGTPKGIAI